MVNKIFTARTKGEHTGLKKNMLTNRQSGRQSHSGYLVAIPVFFSISGGFGGVRRKIPFKLYLVRSIPSPFSIYWFNTALVCKVCVCVCGAGVVCVCVCVSVDWFF